MDNSTLMQNLTILGHSLPGLITAIVALILILTRSPNAAGRNLALTGAALLIGSTLLRLLASLAQTAYYRSEAFADGNIGQLVAFIGGVHFLLSLVDAVGVLMLAWAYCKSAPNNRDESPKLY